MSCRHYCINSKKSFSKTFSFHKIIYKYFAGFLACYLDCHASLCSARNDEKNIVITRFCKNRSNPICVDCHASLRFARNDRYKKQNRTHCAPHGDDNNSHYEGNARDICPPLASNLFCADCFAHARNDGKNIVITRFCKNRSNPQKRNFIILDCFTTVRNDRYEKQNRTRCAPHGDDNIFCDNKNFQFDKFQRLLSVIYKKLIN